MSRDPRTGMMGLVIAWLVIGACAEAQMPITRGKGGRAEAIDEGILGNRVAAPFAERRAPAPPPFPPARVFVRGVNGQRFLTLEQPGATPAEADGDPDGPEEERPPQRPAMPRNWQESTLERENFDRWVFGEGVDEVSRRDRLNSQLWKKLEAVSGRQPLNASQEKKLRLAGRGDIKRFFDRVEDRRREFEVARKRFTDGFAFLNALDPLIKEFEEGPFGDGSLFAKTLRKIENDAQAARPSGN